MRNISIGRLLSHIAHVLVAKMTTSQLEKNSQELYKTCSRSEHMIVMITSHVIKASCLATTYPEL